MVNYPVGDFLIRFKNIALAGKSELVIKKTKLIAMVADLLKKEGFVNEVKQKDGFITVTVANKNKEPMLLGLELVSRPGLRRYVDRREIESKKGPEIYILSTPKGIISSKTAKKEGVGGELIAKVW